MSYSYEDLPRRPSYRLWGWIVAGVVLFTLGAMLVSAIHGVREAARKAACLGQFKFFTLSMHNRHDSQGTFPPAYLADSSGQPQHSWRILLLKYLGDPMFERYDFNEPWDSPHNRALSTGLHIGMSGTHPAYHCASDMDSDRFDTSYVMVVGAGTISAGANTIRMKDIKDGTSNTLIVAEMAESGIPWMAPRDLKFDEMTFRLNDYSMPSLRSKHPGVVNAGFGDGNSRSLSANIDPDVLKALLTIAGGEPRAAEAFQ